jgi:hypothetical protein
MRNERKGFKTCITLVFAFVVESFEVIHQNHGPHWS